MEREVNVHEVLTWQRRRIRAGNRLELPVDLDRFANGYYRAKLVELRIQPTIAGEPEPTDLVKLAVVLSHQVRLLILACCADNAFAHVCAPKPLPQQVYEKSSARTIPIATRETERKGSGNFCWLMKQKFVTPLSH